MSDKTSIEWTEATWNPAVGCDQISPGCAHCYAKAIHDRRHKSFLGGGNVLVPQYATPFEDVRVRPDRLDIPLHWRRPRRVFVNSMSDLFHEDIPDAFIDRVFAVMALADQHTFQILTKRADRMREYVQQIGKRLGELWDLTNQPTWVTLPAGRSFPRYPENWPLPNVWLGPSVENQPMADKRFPIAAELGETSWNVMISIEPLLGPVVVPDRVLALGRRAWIIVGGESGPHSRDCHVDWIRSIEKQCAAAGVPCFVKQLGRQPRVSDGVYLNLRDKKGGDISEFPIDLRVRKFPEVRA